MIIQAYPNAFDTELLSDLQQPRTGTVNLYHLFGSTIMVILMGLIAMATYRRLLSMQDHQAQAGMLEYLAEIGTLCFACLIGGLCLIRLKPTNQAKGLMPTLSALGATFVLTVVNFVPLAELTPLVKSIAVSLLATGNLLSVLFLAYLGRSFSILPQARKLVTTGPYGIVRHPLYVAEAIAAIGLIMLHVSVLSIVTGMVLMCLQVKRVLFEETVLRASFPDYDDYAARVPRFFPKRLPF